tara:strand:- start:674 stop:1201 length:528 start_codon:yes stop_codon:yes gene_type:complete
MRINSNQEFSNVGYAFLMFITDYYKRVSKLKLTFDEMMVLNTVAAQLAYNLKSSESLSIKDLYNLKDEKIVKIFKRSKLSILSIANILDQPKESIRRRVNRLISLNLLVKDKKTGGIMLTEKYSEILKNFSVNTLKQLSFLIQDMEEIGFLSDLLKDMSKKSVINTTKENEKTNY